MEQAHAIKWGKSGFEDVEHWNVLFNFSRYSNTWRHCGCGCVYGWLDVRVYQVGGTLGGMHLLA